MYCAGGRGEEVRAGARSCTPLLLRAGSLAQVVEVAAKKFKGFIMKISDSWETWSFNIKYENCLKRYGNNFELNLLFCSCHSDIGVLKE